MMVGAIRFVGRLLLGRRALGASGCIILMTKDISGIVSDYTLI